MKTLFLFLAFFASAHAQITIGGGATLGGGITIGGTGANPPITGGQLLIPSNSVILNRPPHLFVSSNGKAYFEQTGAAANSETGLWVTPSAAACEAAPTICPWTLLLKATLPTVGGIIQNLNTAIDIDSTHIIMSFGYQASAGGACTSATNRQCIIEIFDTSANTLSPVTLPGVGTGQMMTFIARDSAGLCYTSTLYGGSPIWRSPDATCSGTWTQIATGYANLPGLSGISGNVYVGVVIGSRFYFGGELGVASCDLGFTACSVEYLPPSYAPGTRNVTTIIGDEDYSSSSNATMLLECCKQDSAVANYATWSRWTAGGGWSQLTTSSGLMQFQTSDFFNNFAIAQGTGSSRRYYLIIGSTNGTTTPWAVWTSTSSAATNWTLLSSSILPTPTSTSQAKQIAQGVGGTTHKWVLYAAGADGSPVSAYVLP